MRQFYETTQLEEVSVRISRFDRTRQITHIYDEPLTTNKGVVVNLEITDGLHANCPPHIGCKFFATAVVAGQQSALASPSPSPWITGETLRAEQWLFDQISL